MNFPQVVPGIYRSSRPTVEQLGTSDPRIKTIVNVESGWNEWLHPWLETERLAFAGLGIREFLSPMSNVFPPEQAQVARIAEFINDASWQPVLVHCREGVDRTGVVIAYWRCRYGGWPTCRAWQECLNAGFHRNRFFYWVGRIKRMLDSGAAQFIQGDRI